VSGGASPESILRDPAAEPEAARAALHALGRTLPREALERLLLDEAVMRHGAAGVRRDAACALGVLGTRQADALLALLDDGDFTVARAAWISLWMVTGRAFGLEDDEQFREAPRGGDDLFTRAGVTAAQRVAAEAMLRDDVRRADAARRFRDLVRGDEDAAWPAWSP